MRNRPRPRRQASDLETNIAPDALRDDLRRRTEQRTPSDSMPPRRDEATGESPAGGGGFTPAPDGGNRQHPIHGENQEDATSSDYEREIDRLDAAVRAQKR